MKQEARENIKKKKKTQTMHFIKVCPLSWYEYHRESFLLIHIYQALIDLKKNVRIFSNMKALSI